MDVELEMDKTWEQMTREELDYQYSPSSELVKKTIECELGVSYGITDKQKLDIFGAQTLPGDAPIFMYIHGGYWQQLSRELSSFMVQPLCKAGAVVVVVGYDLAPQANMEMIVSQIKKATAYVLNLAKRRGSSGVYLCGHSAGGHLAAMMLSVDWMSECMISRSLIKGAVLISGVFDLRPLVNSYVNEPIKMNIETAWNNSPNHHIDKIIKYSKDRKIIVVIGQYDPPTFRAQSKDFYKALQEGGISSLYIDVADTDHFNVVENLEFEEYVVTLEIIRMMNLNIDSIVTGMSKANTGTD
ncbi:hypothetical protein KUTeg_006636 [Tegillarca granosa]|uniref:Kynurenine formamidase n=1 Tax=Tegillarca granosa TaxID=220873 RepID=A0ABQ9FE41_TEGGR|nr:hypothetical protein KUTeg_006636 [Tegillarca granosa]